MSKPAKLDLRLLLHVARSDSFVQFRAALVLINEDGKVRNLSATSSRFSPEFGLADLTVTAQADVNSEGDWYGVHVQYQEPFVVDIHRAEAMVKVLRKVNKVFEAAGERLDWIPNLEVAFDLLSRALGLPYRGILIDAGSNGTGQWGYDGRSHTDLTAGEAATWADQELAKVRGKVTA